MSDHLSLYLTAHPRRWRIGESCGEVFDEHVDHDGHVLTIELLDEAEADALARALRRVLPHWRPSEDTGGTDA